MKLSLNKKQLTAAVPLWLREAGYTYIEDRNNGQSSYVRRLTRDFYPRFHLYFQEESETSGLELIIFNLHLDQKKPGYVGYNRHNAEYDGELVEAEINRLKSLALPDFFI